MKIDVTADDIAAGCPNRAYYCPVAIALRRATNQDWFVGDVILDPCIGEPYEGSEIPKSVRRFVRRFDRHEPVKPFSFELPESPLPAK